MTICCGPQTALYDLSAEYTDGTTFAATYDDPDADGICAPCLLVAASAVLGTTLQAVVDMGVNAFQLDLGQLHHDRVTVAQVTDTGSNPSFLFQFEELIPAIDLDWLAFSSFVTITDLECSVSDPGVGCLTGSGLSTSASLIHAMITHTSVPLPSAFWILATALAALAATYRRNRNSAPGGA